MPEIREEIQKSAKHFKKNWIDFAKILHKVNQNQLFEHWGYKSIVKYAKKELNIKRETVFKLLSSYDYLIDEKIDLTENENIPSIESLNQLKKIKDDAKKDTNLDEDSFNEIYQSLKDEAFNNNISANTIKKKFNDYTNDSEEEVEENDITKEEAKKASFHFKRFYSIFTKLELPNNVHNSLEEVNEFFEDIKNNKLDK